MLTDALQRVFLQRAGSGVPGLPCKHSNYASHQAPWIRWPGWGELDSTVQTAAALSFKKFLSTLALPHLRSQVFIHPSLPLGKSKPYNLYIGSPSSLAPVLSGNTGVPSFSHTQLFPWPPHATVSFLSLPCGMFLSICLHMHKVQDA